MELGNLESDLEECADEMYSLEVPVERHCRAGELQASIHKIASEFHNLDDDFQSLVATHMAVVTCSAAELTRHAGQRNWCIGQWAHAVDDHIHLFVPQGYLENDVQSHLSSHCDVPCPGTPVAD